MWAMDKFAMRILRNTRLVAALGFTLIALVLLGVFLLRTPSREVSRAEMISLFEAGKLGKVVVTPTMYPGIYHLEGVLRKGKGLEKVFITTHLDESQVKEYFSEKGVRVEMP